MNVMNRIVKPDQEFYVVFFANSARASIDVYTDLNAANETFNHQLDQIGMRGGITELKFYHSPRMQGSTLNGWVCWQRKHYHRDTEEGDLIADLKSVKAECPININVFGE